MEPPDLVRSRKVRHGSRDPKHAMEPARRQSHRRCCVGEKLASGLIRRRNTVEQFAVGLGICSSTGPIVPVGLHLARGGHPACDFGTALGRWRKRKIGGGHALDVDV